MVAPASLMSALSALSFAEVIVDTPIFIGNSGLSLVYQSKPALPFVIIGAAVALALKASALRTVSGALFVGTHHAPKFDLRVFLLYPESFTYGVPITLMCEIILPEHQRLCFTAFSVV